MSRLPGQAGPSWGEASDSYPPYIPESTSSHSRTTYAGGPPTYHPLAPSQTVLVAGCSAGTGLDVAGSYAASGARIIFTSRDQEAIDRTTAAMTSQYPEAEIAGRLHEFADEAAIRNLWRDLGGADVFVDVLILNVAKKWPPATLLGMGSKRGRKGYSYTLIAPGIWIECFRRQRERDPSRDLHLLDLTSNNPSNVTPVLLAAGEVADPPAPVNPEEGETSALDRGTC